MMGPCGRLVLPRPLIGVDSSCRSATAIGFGDFTLHYRVQIGISPGQPFDSNLNMARTGSARGFLWTTAVTLG